MIVDQFQDKRILVIGDVMLDHFVRGSVGRVSPEAPALVLHVSNDHWAVGGAGNVAQNIAGPSKKPGSSPATTTCCAPIAKASASPRRSRPA